MLKHIILAVTLFLTTFSVSARASDLTEFDYPLLLGDWYWFSNTDAGVESEGASYRAMNIKFKSNYRFVIRLLQTSGNVEEWEGTYDIDETTVTFLTHGQPEQQHSYMLSYNQFLLDGARFTKLAPENLPGNWRSSQISGQDVGDAVSEIALSLRPDFLFSAEVSGKNGKKKEHRGIYFIEDDRIVLIYEDGQQDSQFSLGSNTLTLTNKQFGMEAVMRRE
ncbi:hypothetical protein C9J03_22380 [Photobacterium gaetbulicola]|uniref:Lipocalin-like domain-containing protein n=2 Tax=Photobacterium gaetbulicola TaxID=1295392 RepID=A0A0C5WZX2_9GAMM|nr:lipocalin family protein [Photobacterium gaetbulicola]AJR08615.1 hypothetical protein H744_2c1951 [Photobacterium gaetbulicola Gung47]KHT63701.1 WD40 repeat protein [Photobacterium gaetbulicola]PSU02944.1 hypothetical protein C9J03_22380 [Photobacterium gaetbulicola]